jgi:hypothetical protein
MNKQERKHWARYIRQVADLMGLVDWKVVLDNETAGNNNGAEMNSVYGRKEAHVRLSADWPTFSAKEQRYYVVHELTHAYFEPMDHLLYKKMGVLLSAQDAQAWRDDYILLLEYGIDDCAKTISQQVPLPTPFSKKTEAQA